MSSGLSGQCCEQAAPGAAALLAVSMFSNHQHMLHCHDKVEGVFAFNRGVPSIMWCFRVFAMVFDYFFNLQKHEARTVFRYSRFH